MSSQLTQRGGRTRWREYVISKAYFLEHERNRLCDRECESAQTTSYALFHGHAPESAPWSAPQTAMAILPPPPRPSIICRMASGTSPSG